MILQKPDKRKYVREAPSKKAIKIFIFCEGAKREYQYFSCFRGLDSRIDPRIIQTEQHDNNSPTGLFEKAQELFKVQDIELRSTDYVWFIVDVDKWTQINDLKNDAEEESWFVGISNPCFEVWLYYHFFDSYPDFENMHISKSWKSFVNKKISGGFDSKRCFVLIDKAIENSKKNYKEKDDIPIVGTTDVFKLGQLIYQFVKNKI